MNIVKEKTDIIFAITLVEILLVIIFCILLCAGIMNDEGVEILGKEEILKNEINELKTQLEATKQSIKSKNRKISELNNSLENLKKNYNLLISNLSKIDKTLFSYLPSELVKIIQTNGDYSKEGRGPGKPYCSVCSDFLFKVFMNEDNTLNIICNWDPIEDSELMEIASINNLYNKVHNKNCFRYETEPIFIEIFKYCKKNNCRFKIEIYDNTETKKIFINQLKYLEKYFYVAKRW